MDLSADADIKRSLNLRVGRRAVDVDYEVRIRAVKALRVAPPALRAARRLDCAFANL